MDQVAARLMLAEDPEAAMLEDMAAAIRARRSAGVAAPTPGEKLRLLLVGYSGAGNIGADIRVHEIVRQLRAIYGRDRLTLALITRGSATVALDDVALEHFGGYFPTGMAEVIERYDAVLICEGSLFKSNFSNTLTTMLAGALGMAGAQGKPAISYGVEAGAMDAGITAFVQEFCRESLIFCRSAGSLAQVRDVLGLAAQPGADTAWSFTPAPPVEARAILREAGWNGSDPILALCPINPYWWPVKPDILRLFAGDVGSEDHYDSILYHHRSDDTDKRFARYIDALAQAAATHIAATGGFPVVIGMERLDRAACLALAAALPGAAPVITSADQDARHMVAILRQASMVVSSRYHAVVTAMPAGVPTIGVTMDERLRNLLRESGLPDLSIPVDDPTLAATLSATMRAADADRAAVGDSLRAMVEQQRAAQERMGRDVAHALHRLLPRKAARMPMRA